MPLNHSVHLKARNKSLQEEDSTNEVVCMIPKSWVNKAPGPTGRPVETRSTRGTPGFVRTERNDTRLWYYVAFKLLKQIKYLKPFVRC